MSIPSKEQIAKLKLYNDNKDTLASLGYVECEMCGELIKAPTKSALTRRKYCDGCRKVRSRVAIQAKRTAYLEESDEHKYNPSSDILTHYCFKYSLQEDEFKSLGQFFSSRCKPISSIMAVIKVNHKNYSLSRTPINTYNKQDVLEKAKRWANNPRSGKLRKHTLDKVIAVLDN